MPDHRVTEEWMGERIETLADLLEPGLRAACVGINPSVVSLAKGHYYQGRLGKRFYARLRRVGLLPESIEGFEDDALFERGVGFTDVVKRPTARADQLRSAEYEHGRETLLGKLHRHRPSLVIFSYKKTAEVLFGRFAGHGERPSPIEGVRLFVMPGPFERTAAVEGGLRELAAILA